MSDLPTPDLHSPKGKKIMIITGAAGGAYVVYAWWRSRQAAAASAAAGPAPTDAGYVTQSTPGAPGQYAGNSPDGGGSSGSLDGTAAPLDNAAWSQLAVQLLVGAGYDAATVAACLGKYLGRQPLTDSEAMVVRAALAMAGPPPVGSYVIIPISGSPPPSTPPPATQPPATGGNPPSAGTPVTQHKYPERKTFHTNVKNDNYTKIAQQYGTGLTGQQLYDYQFTPQAGRSASAIQKLRQYGPNRIYVGGSTAIPYPK